MKYLSYTLFHCCSLSLSLYMCVYIYIYIYIYKIIHK